VKQFLYFTIFFASIGTIGLVASNPKLVQQGASYLGVAPAGSQESSSNQSGDDHLAKFLSHYPGKDTSPELPTPSPFPAKPETTIIPPPPIPPAAPTLTKPAPPLPSPPKIEPPKVEPLKPEPPKVEPLKTEPLKSEPPKTELLKIEPPNPAPPTTEIATLPVIGTSLAVKTSETPEDVGAGFASSRHGAVPPSAIESLEKWSEPPVISVIPDKNEPLPPFVPSPPETTPTLPVISAPPVAPETTANANDPFLQTLNSQPVSTSEVPIAAVSTFAAPVLPVPASAQASMPPVKSVYDVQPLPLSSPAPPQVPQPLPSSLASAPQQQPQHQLMESQPALQQTSLSVPQPKVGSQFQINPSVLVEEVPCYGTETVARVGTQVILMCDLLPQLRRAGYQIINENLKKVSDAERSQVSETEKENVINSFVENQYPAFLQEQITVALVFNDYLLAKSKEERDMFNKKFGEEFDQHEVPALIKEFGVQNNVELKQFLKDKLGSSLDRERMLWIRSKIAQQWIMFNMQDASSECTHDEMMEFYTKHKEQFTSELRIQWQELFVAFSNHPTEEAARNKIAWIGNQVVAGYPFEEIAKVNSEGFTASKGGFWDWTKKGSLTSPELEQAVFSSPVNKMSPIIKGDKGFHIVRVVKREEAETTPFIEAQVTIREQIKMERRQKLQSEYFVELKKRYPTRILRERIDFNLNQ
jgi:parvulin-like peptidyl-prolyl isomerase